MACGGQALIGVYYQRHAGGRWRACRGDTGLYSERQVTYASYDPHVTRVLIIRKIPVCNFKKKSITVTDSVRK